MKKSYNRSLSYTAFCQACRKLQYSHNLTLQQRRVLIQGIDLYIEDLWRVESYCLGFTELELDARHGKLDAELAYQYITGNNIWEVDSYDDEELF